MKKPTDAYGVRERPLKVEDWESAIVELKLRIADLMLLQVLPTSRNTSRQELYIIA